MEIGERIGDYEILGVLGAGGMGKVYKVRNVISDRVEAMKVLLPNLEADAELGDRFLREIKVQAALEHPNIAALRTAQRAGNSLLMVMEFVEGQTIEALMKQGHVPIEKAVDYASQVLAALDYAHKQGVIHRDIKPANMMLTPAGVVKLMDFGIARLLADEKLTQTGRTVGSLYYMSPEQIRGDATLDARADLYSLGVALYELATGNRPFEGDSAYSVMAAHLQQQPAPPIQIDPGLPSALNEIILMAIAKDPAKRFQSAAAMRAALSRFAPATAAPAPVPQPVAAPPPPAAPVQAAPPARSSKRWLYMTVGSLATIAVLVVAAIQIPKWRGAGAAPSQETPPPISTPAAEPQAQQQQPPAEQTLPPAQQTQQPAPAAAPTAEARRTPMPAQTQQQPVRNVPAQQQPAPAAAQQPVQAPPQSAPPPQQSAPQPAAQQQPVQPQQQASPPPNAAADEAREKAVMAARQRLMIMAARVNSVKATMSTLQRQQAASGLGIRGDMMAAYQRMEFHLDEAERAMKGGDPATARKGLAAAEKELERLEAWLGR